MCLVYRYHVFAILKTLTPRSYSAECVAPSLIFRTQNAGVPGSGQSNMDLAVGNVNNATAEVAAASWPLIRIAKVKYNPVYPSTPQNDTAFSQPWGAITPANIGAFSGLCYYFGRRMFRELGGTTPVGLVQQSVGGTYVESFMPAADMAACNTAGRMPPGWRGAPPKNAGGKPYLPWGGSNVPAELFNTMLSPLTSLQFKLAIYDQAEQNLATNESAIYGCLQDQLVAAWREIWGENLTFHAVQLPSLNMSEYTWIYIDWETSLGQMRLSQASTSEHMRGTTMARPAAIARLSLCGAHSFERHRVILRHPVAAAREI